MSLSALSANRTAAKPLGDRPKSSTNLTSSPKEKKSLPPPITASTFAMFALLQMCRRYILFKLEWRIGVYMVMVTFFSVITDFYPVPKALTFSWCLRNSLLNLVFVKVTDFYYLLLNLIVICILVLLVVLIVDSWSVESVRLFFKFHLGCGKSASDSTTVCSFDYYIFGLVLGHFCH